MLGTNVSGPSSPILYATSWSTPPPSAFPLGFVGKLFKFVGTSSVISGLSCPLKKFGSSAPTKVPIAPVSAVAPFSNKDTNLLSGPIASPIFLLIFVAPLASANCTSFIAVDIS